MVCGSVITHYVAHSWKFDQHTIRYLFEADRWTSEADDDCLQLEYLSSSEQGMEEESSLLDH